jgi:hypothetical protein
LLVVAGPVVPLLVAGGIAVALTALLGARVGLRREWGLFRLAVPSAAAVVALSVTAVWLSSFFVPDPGESGGAFEIVGLPLLVVIVGVPVMGALVTLLAMAAGIGSVVRSHAEKP